MYTVTIPTYEELQVMFPSESTATHIRNAGLTIWEFHTDEMRIPHSRILEFSEIRTNDTMYDAAYDIYIHKSFYDYLKTLESKTFGTQRYLWSPHSERLRF